MNTTPKPHAGELAAAIAAHLGDGWHAAPWRDEDTEGDRAARAHLRHGTEADALRLFLSTGRWNQHGRLVVEMCSLRHPNGSQITARDALPWAERNNVPKMTADAGRPAATLAREIKRRMIAPAAPIWQTMLEHRDKSIAALNRADDLEASLSQAWLAEANRYHHHERSTQRSLYMRGGALSGEVKITGESVSVELSYLPAALAIELGAAVREIAQRFADRNPKE